MALVERTPLATILALSGAKEYKSLPILQLEEKKQIKI